MEKAQYHMYVIVNKIQLLHIEKGKKLASNLVGLIKLSQVNIFWQYITTANIDLQCSKLKVHPAPCVHILAVGCKDFSTCAFFFFNILITSYIRKNTWTNCQVHSFGYLCAI